MAQIVLQINDEKICKSKDK
jgi:flagellar biosynthesis GTPase FlhF